jgi:N-acetyl-anhydromuramyl-L-alanine amidase AmpD
MMSSSLGGVVGAVVAGLQKLNQLDGLNIENGMIVGDKVVDKRIVELEHGPMMRVDAIVLHQTDSSKLNLDHARNDGIGAHFYIDKDGTIYQTARLDQSTWHVGKIKSKCYEEKTCTPDEQKAIKSMIQDKNWSSEINKHESEKAYPDRYPNNSDSIGIEVVGKYNESTKTFDRPTEAQTQSLKWLTRSLAKEFGLDINSDVYIHPQVSYKQEDEARSLVYQ